MSVSRGSVQYSILKESRLKMAIIPIQAVIFDMGGTLENLYSDESIRQEATLSLRDLLRGLNLDPGLSLAELQSRVLAGIKAYQAWREESEIELSPERVWTEYILTNQCSAKESLAAAAEDMTLFYETHFQLRSLRPEAPAALDLLHKQGLRLAIISNIISRRLVPKKLTEYGIAALFRSRCYQLEFWLAKTKRAYFRGDCPTDAAAALGLCLRRRHLVPRRDRSAARRIWLGHSDQIFSHRQI